MANFAGFASALAQTASHVTTDKKFVYNIATPVNYATCFYMLLGRRMADILRGGSDVRARVKFSTSSQAGWYNTIAENHNPQIGQDGTWAIAYWCAHMAHESWKEEELLINKGGTGLGDTIEETWTDELWNKYQSLMTALYNDIEASFWRRPNAAKMAGTDPEWPTSIPAYLNVHTNGLFVEDASTTWTVINGITVASNTRYVPYRGTFSNYTPATASNFIEAISKAVRKTSFTPPPRDKEYFNPESDDAVDKSGGAVFCSADGIAKAENLYRNSNDRWPDWMDPAGNPRFKGIQLVYVAALDDIAVYPNASGHGQSTEAAATITGPRYYGVNAQYLRMMWHKRRFFEWLDPFRQNLTTWTQGVNSLGTMLCPDRSKLFFLSPSTSL